MGRVLGSAPRRARMPIPVRIPANATNFKASAAGVLGSIFHSSPSKALAGGTRPTPCRKSKRRSDPFSFRGSPHARQQPQRTAEEYQDRERKVRGVINLTQTPRPGCHGVY